MPPVIPAHAAEHVVNLADPPDSATAYPVLADPDWGYEFYDNLQILYTAHDVINNLHACFNCEFPVSGAPT